MGILFFTLFISAFCQINPENSKMNKEALYRQADPPLFSFGLLADVQYANCDPLGTRFYRNSLVKLADAVGTFRNSSVSFVVNLGDLIDRDFNSFMPVLDILNSSGLKIYHCTGNHDYNVENKLKSHIPVPGNSQSGYYSVDIKGFRLIFLDGNEISTYASDDKDVIGQAADLIRGLKRKGFINAMDWNGGIGNSQLLWLDGQLTQAASKNEKIIIFCHFPVAPEDIHNLLNYKEVLSHVGNDKNVVAWMNGHNHAGNYTVINGIHFITFKGMVETETISSYSIVDVYRDKIIIHGFGNEKDRTLKLN
jgi:manganese-dependent ADP-ribose/CDP-alcohol diphosphatase